MSERGEGGKTGEVLAEFMIELLGVTQVSQDDYLIDLGGNSLIATMLANRIELYCGFRPSLEALLTRSLGELAVLCEENRCSPLS